MSKWSGEPLFVQRVLVGDNPMPGHRDACAIVYNCRGETIGKFDSDEYITWSDALAESDLRFHDHIPDSCNVLWLTQGAWDRVVVSVEEDETAWYQLFGSD